MLKIPLMGQPGKQWYYSGAPDVLSVLIEKFSGQTTRDYLEEKIFIPLGMESTGYNVLAQDEGRIMPLFILNEEGLKIGENQVQSSGNTVWSGVNGLFSTVTDYMKFCQMLLNGGELNGHRILSRKTVELMTLNHTGDLFGNPGEGFGLGFAVVDDLAETANLGSEGLFHWGGANNTHFYIDPKEKLISIFFTQVQPYDSYYHDMLRQMVYQAFVD